MFHTYVCMPCDGEGVAWDRLQSYCSCALDEQYGKWRDGVRELATHLPEMDLPFRDIIVELEWSETEKTGSSIKHGGCSLNVLDYNFFCQTEDI